MLGFRARGADELWSNGVVEYWSIGKQGIQADRNLKVFAALQHSNPPGEFVRQMVAALQPEPVHLVHETL